MAYRDEPKEPVSVAVAIIVAIVYVVAAVLCALCFLTTDIVAGLLGKIISSLNEASLQALVQLYGYMLLALMPSAIIFLANKAPFEMTTFTRVLLWIVGVLGMAGLIWLFFHISAQPEYAETLGKTGRDLYGITWLRVSSIVSAVGVISINVMSNFRPNFNPNHWLGGFCDVIWEFAQGQISYVLFTLLCFATLPWAFLILPISGVYIFVLLTTLYALCDSGD
ncbi:MAG: hypothetical protein J1G02_04890 [Clostridiales bacterium]|nr:hypothetical protein [Clostridiales bacterium]